MAVQPARRAAPFRAQVARYYAACRHALLAALPRTPAQETLRKSGLTILAELLAKSFEASPPPTES